MNMQPANVTHADLRAELQSAEAENGRATQQALQKGLVATQPLTATRLSELCELGERMYQTQRRRDAALERLRACT